MSSNSGKDFMFGLLSGAVIGSLVAILYAPDKGSTTRDRVSYHLSHYLDELAHLIERLKKEQAFVSEAKQQGDQVVEDAQKRAEDLKSEVEELLSTIDSAKKSE